MKKFSARLARLTCVFAVSFAAASLAVWVIRHTPWFKERLYHQLVHGGEEQRLRAASVLVQVDGQAQLLAALQCRTPAIHDLARRALERIWFTEAGEEAFRLAESASDTAGREDFRAALAVCHRLIEKYPGFAEGWNRRASVYWEMGEYAKSLADCRRALELNPQHYGAWQGAGICQLELGQLAEACRSLRAVLKILPHDTVTREALKRCEELLRRERGEEGEKFLEVV